MEKGNPAETGTGTATATSTPPPAAGSTTGAGPGTGTGTAPESTTGQTSGGQAADQTGPAWNEPYDWPAEPTKAERLEADRQWRPTATDDELREAAAQADAEVERYQNGIDEELASENPDNEWIDEARPWIDEMRDFARGNRQELHEREMARPSPGAADSGPPPAPQGPSGEVLHPGGARTGVDPSGQGYEVDSSGQRTARERFDRFRPTRSQ